MVVSPRGDDQCPQHVGRTGNSPFSSRAVTRQPDGFGIRYSYRLLGTMRMGTHLSYYVPLARRIRLIDDEQKRAW